MMAGGNAQHLLAAGQFKGVDKIRTAEKLFGHFQCNRAVVGVNQVIRANQHIHKTAFTTARWHLAVNQPQLGFNAVVTHHFTGNQHPVTDKIRHITVRRTVVEVITAVPLHQLAV